MEKYRGRNYLSLVTHYEGCLEKYGDTCLGVDWPNEEDALTRYQVMLDIVRIREKGKTKISLLDFGCGASHLYDYILSNNLDYLIYSGLDISDKYISLSREKHPNINFYCMDILKQQTVRLPQFDYVVLNGVFTEKRELSQEEMWGYFKAMITSVYKLAKVGIAFNLMSSYVDWKRADLFHVPINQLGTFLTENISRDFVIRHDYQLYEYTTYVYRR
jgi:hypothetical protein